jgi:hypothetical protein
MTYYEYLRTGELLMPGEEWKTSLSNAIDCMHKEKAERNAEKAARKRDSVLRERLAHLATQDSGLVMPWANRQMYGNAYRNHLQLEDPSFNTSCP